MSMTSVENGNFSFTTDILCKQRSFAVPLHNFDHMINFDLICCLFALDTHGGGEREGMRDPSFFFI